MRFSSLYRISFYVMLTLATLTLTIDSGQDNPLSPLLPIVVAAAGLVAFLTVDRDPKRGLTRGTARFLAIGSILLSYGEYLYGEWFNGTPLLVLALGHWLVYLQLIKMFLPKTVADDWFLYLVALTQVVVGAFLPGEHVGIALMAWALSALWTLSLFYLHREAVPAAQPVASAHVTPEPDPKEPYPGLIDGAFVVSGLKVALLTLALGGVIFLLMPRWGLASRPRNRSPQLAQNLTGFSDTVELGRMGEILESEDIVMTIELYDETRQRVAPSEDALWRGVVMRTYSNGRWSRQAPDPINFGTAVPEGPLPVHYYRQEIKLESTANGVLFAMRPILRTSGTGLVFNQNNGALLRGDIRLPGVTRLIRGRSEPYDYAVTSSANINDPQYGERFPNPNDLYTKLLAVPQDEALREALREITDRVLDGIPVGDLKARSRAWSPTCAIRASTPTRSA